MNWRPDPCYFFSKNMVFAKRLGTFGGCSPYYFGPLGASGTLGRGQKPCFLRFVFHVFWNAPTDLFRLISMRGARIWPQNGGKRPGTRFFTFFCKSAWQFHKKTAPRCRSRRMMPVTRSAAVDTHREGAYCTINTMIDLQRLSSFVIFDVPEP